MARIVSTAAVNAIRNEYNVYNPVSLAYEDSILLEGTSINLCTESEDLANANWTKSPGVTVTSNSTIAPDGNLTADLVITDGSLGSLNTNHNLVFTADGTKVISCYFKAGSAAMTEFGVYDTTAAIMRRLVRITWTAGVATVISVTGTGTIFPVTSLANGWYRVSVAVDAVVAANINRFYIYPAGTAAVAGNVYAWGAQAENQVFPSSYIPTAAATVTRSADNYSVPFNLPPQEMTVYCKFIEKGTGYMSTGTGGIIHIGSTVVGAMPRLIIYNRLGSGRYTFYHNTSSGTVLADASLPVPIIGDLVELRGILSSTGACTLGISINGGAEVVSATSAALTLGTAWADTKLFLGTPPGGAMCYNAFQSIKVARGTLTLAQMRAL